MWKAKSLTLNYIFGQFKALNAPKLNDTLILYKDSKIVAYSHARGCMCYYKRVCLEKVGGWIPYSENGGYEHPQLSNRIYNAGLTSFRYMDVPNSDKLIYSLDEHNGNTSSTVIGAERQKWIARNLKIYEDTKNQFYYVPFRE